MLGECPCLEKYENAEQNVHTEHLCIMQLKITHFHLIFIA